jgi:hypothetical protein
LNVRLLSTDALSVDNLEEAFARYASISWPGARTATCWTEGPRRGLTGVFEEAMPGVIVREWLVTDGQKLANAATFATAQQWKAILADCERLVRSIRFEPTKK